MQNGRKGQDVGDWRVKSRVSKGGREYTKPVLQISTKQSIRFSTPRKKGSGDNKMNR